MGHLAHMQKFHFTFHVREQLLLNDVLYCSSQSVLILTTMKSLLTQLISMATMNAYKGFL